MSGGLGPNLLSAPNGPFASGVWTATALTETTGQTDPFGGTNASLLTDTAAASTHMTVLNVPVAAGTNYRVGIYFKPGTFATGIDVDAGRTNGGGTVHITNAGVVSVVGGNITNLSSVSVGGFFACAWNWVPGLSGIGLYTISFGVGADNAPLSYTGTVQNLTLYGASIQQVG